MCATKKSFPVSKMIELWWQSSCDGDRTKINFSSFSTSTKSVCSAIRPHSNYQMYSSIHIIGLLQEKICETDVSFARVEYSLIQLLQWPAQGCPRNLSETWLDLLSPANTPREVNHQRDLYISISLFPFSLSIWNPNFMPSSSCTECAQQSQIYTLDFHEVG